MIVDEAQSLERNVLLTVLSRIGANSKVVLTHDVAQRDNLRVGRHDGVVAVVDRLKGHPLFAHVTLTRSERSPIAALVTEMLEHMTSDPCHGPRGFDGDRERGHAGYRAVQLAPARAHRTGWNLFLGTLRASPQHVEREMTSMSSTLGITLSEKHAAKHRCAPTTSLHRRLGGRLRGIAALSAVAVVGTGLAVSTGVLAQGSPIHGAAAALSSSSSSSSPTGGLTESELADRVERASRSTGDRRPVADQTKARTLSNASGHAVTKTEDLDPLTPRPSRAP